LHETISRYFFATFGDCLFILLFNSGTNCGHTTHQDFFSDCALCLWEFCKNCIDIHTAWLNALWLWTLWEFWWCLKERTTWTVSASFSAFTTLATCLVTITTLAARLVTVTTWSTTLVTVTATLLSKLLCHCFKGLIGRKNL
jgi:hypothetical protein